MLRREPADGRPVKGQIAQRFQQELLVVIEHVQTSLNVRETQGHRLDMCFLFQPRRVLLLQLLCAGLLGTLRRLEIHGFQLIIGDFEKALQVIGFHCRHRSSLLRAWREHVCLDTPMKHP